MTSVFSKIIDGELPARFVWQDPHVVAFLTIAPLRPGHTLVVPRREVDHWPDVDDGLMGHCMRVAQAIGHGVQQGWDAPRAGLVIAGFEVHHLHLHVFPVWGLSDFDFAKVDHDPDPDELDQAAQTLRATLRELGHSDTVPD